MAKISKFFTKLQIPGFCQIEPLAKACSNCRDPGLPHLEGLVWWGRGAEVYTKWPVFRRGLKLLCHLKNQVSAMFLKINMDPSDCQAGSWLFTIRFILWVLLSPVARTEHNGVLSHINWFQVPRWAFLILGAQWRCWIWKVTPTLVGQFDDLEKGCSSLAVCVLWTKQW